MKNYVRFAAFSPIMLFRRVPTFLTYLKEIVNMGFSENVAGAPKSERFSFFYLVAMKNAL